MTSRTAKADRFARERFSGLFTLTLLAAMVFGCCGAWVDYFYDVDAPRYATASLEMAQTGDYLRPMDNGVPRLAKPPLPYWLTAPLMQAFMAVGGPDAVTPATARIPAILAAVAAVAAAMLIGRRLFGPLAGLLAGLALAASEVFHLLGYLPRVDIFFAAALAWASWFLLLRLQGDRRSRVVLGAAVFTALGVLARGPFAFYPLNAYIRAAAVDGYLLRVHGPDGRERNVQELLSIKPLLEVFRNEWRLVAVCAAVGCAPFFLWLYLAKALGGVDYWAGFVQQVDINVTEESTTFWDKFWQTGFYGDTLIFVFFPWGSFLLGVLVDFGRGFAHRRREVLFFVFYLLVAVLSATFVHKLKSHRYVLAIIPWLAVWVVGWLVAAPDTRRKRVLVEICTWWALGVTAFFAYRWFNQDIIPINIYFDVPAPEGVLRWVLLGSVAVFAGLCAWGGFTQRKAPARHVLLLVLGFALVLPLYHQALPKGDPPAARDGLLLGPAVGDALRRRFDEGALVANSLMVADRYPDVQFFQKDLAENRVFYSLNVGGGPLDLAMLLKSPDRAPGFMAVQYPEHRVLPAWRFFTSRSFERAVLVLMESELPRVLALAKEWGMDDVQAQRIEGYDLKFKRDALCLVWRKG